MSQNDIGVVGLAVMGRNLVLNLSDHGHSVGVFNRTYERTREFLQHDASGRAITGAESLANLVGSLKSPRVILLMVKAGRAVDAVIDELQPLLEQGDIVIDGGNSHYPDTVRRYEALRGRGLRFLGMGISGGEEGARYGPSLMPGGDPEAWPHVKDMFQSIAARVDGEPCCQWVGEAGAGHYVKMVHNGIEYGDMQLICECYQLLREGLGLSAGNAAAVFKGWNQGVLESYLIEITGEILAVEDPDGVPRVDRILDQAGQKGTGKWTAVDALQQGVPLTLIGEAVNARFLSAAKRERTRASGELQSGLTGIEPPPGLAIDQVRDALYAAKIVSYAQGFMLLRAASEGFGWNLAFGDIALLWRGGCIIRSRFLGDIKAAYERRPELDNLLLDQFFTQAIGRAIAGWRATIAVGVTRGLPLPALSAALAFYDGYRSARLPANLLQAQRDYFGAHSYRRTDQDPASSFHTDWTGDQSEVRVDD